MLLQVFSTMSALLECCKTTLHWYWRSRKLHRFVTTTRRPLPNVSKYVFANTGRISCIPSETLCSRDASHTLMIKLSKFIPLQKWTWMNSFSFDSFTSRIQIQLNPRIKGEMHAIWYIVQVRRSCKSEIFIKAEVAEHLKGLSLPCWCRIMKYDLPLPLIKSSC